MARVVVSETGTRAHAASLPRNWLGTEHAVLVPSTKPDDNWVSPTVWIPPTVWMGVELPIPEEMVSPT